MKWDFLNFSIRQDFQGAYRYLDKCGELYCKLELNDNFIPGIANPQSAGLNNPEKHADINLDPNGAVITQSYPDDNGEYIIEIASKLEDHYWDLIQASSLDRSVCTITSFIPASSEEDVFKKLKKCTNYLPFDIGDIEMELRAHHINIDFKFGSKILMVKTEGFHHNNEKKKVVNNFYQGHSKKKQINRINDIEHNDNLSWGLRFQTILFEIEPVKSTVADLFNFNMDKHKLIRKKIIT